MKRLAAVALLIALFLTQAIQARAVGYAVGIRCDENSHHMVSWIVEFGPHGNIRSYPEPWASPNAPLCSQYYRHHKKPKKGG